MVYAIDIFKTLIQQFPSFTNLLHFLESPAGGSLRAIKCDQDRYIIRYNKSTTNFALPHVPWFRSVVWNATTHLPECVAPPKAHEVLTTMDGMVCEELLEGVMLNAFLDASGTVNLVSRTKMGATGTFYSSRSFHDLLLDALKERGMNDLQALKGLFDNNATFMSLLLQHPEHRIVSKHTAPTVHVIHKGRVEQDGSVHIDEDQGLPRIAVPATIEPSVIQSWISQLAEQRGWAWQGVVLKDGQGGRWRFRSNTYNMVRTLRGDSAREDVRFLRLRERQMVDTYLYYYPEDAGRLWNYEQGVRLLTHILYGLYVNTHMKHEIKFADLPPYWKTHVYTLHSKYLTVLKAQGHFIRKKDVIQYINDLPIPRILHLMKNEASLSMPMRVLAQARSGSLNSMSSNEQVTNEVIE